VTTLGPIDQTLVVRGADSVDAPVEAASPQASTPTLRELFDAHAAYVWNTFRHLGAPAADLEDLTQDLFLEVRRHVADYDLARPIRPWLFGFAFRLAAQHRRRTARRRESHHEGWDEIADCGVPQDEALARAQDRRLVLEALDAIEFDRRAVFVLYEIDGEKMSDVAAALGIPVNTAYSRLRVGREEFAAAVKRLVARRGR
jgi:RNA polymerase sigma-70 factor (ECF subfamily)